MHKSYSEELFTFLVLKENKLKIISIAPLQAQDIVSFTHAV